jgi:hypothetical protein
MKKITLLIVVFTLVFTTPNLYSQDGSATKATSYGKLEKPIYVPSLAQQVIDGTFIGIDPNEEPKLGPPKRRGANIAIPGKGLPKGNDALVGNQESAIRLDGKDPILVFDANVANYTPSDPTGAVGPNHFIGAWNVGFRIFDKSGNPLTDAASLGTLFPGNTQGDPIVFYDAEADRFVITEFNYSSSPVGYGFSMAVCQGPDPVNDGWYIYTPVNGFSTTSSPDYTKFSVWSDGYYVTANIGATNKVFAVEREEMLLGNAAQFVGFPLPGITTSGFYSPQFFNVTNDDLPPSGSATVVYMQDDAWAGVATDHLKLWTVNVDWDTIANSTISNPVEIVTTPYISVFDGGSFSNVPQPSGPDQDVLQATIMNQAQYRRFPGYNSAIFNFVIDTDGTSGELAGIRWYELRQDTDGDPWTIYQEGTYISPYNDKHAFSGSMVMDGQGNIGMGYTTCNETEKIAIYYTARYADDPLGQMTIDETLIAQSTSNNSSNRLADYVQISLDPTNDKTFWHIAEYFINSQRNDVGVNNINEPNNGELSDDEVITITVRNYGEDEQSNIPVNYQIDGGNIVSEILTDTLTSGESVQYSFATTANLGTQGQTYEITSFTNLSDDEWRPNDTISKSVHHLFANDIGVTDINSPVSGSGLADDEAITVSIKNFGYAEHSNFDVTYNLDDIIVTEQVPGPLTMDSPLTYTFMQTGDFSALGTYNLSSYTSLPNDADINNDTSTVVIENSMCQPHSNCSDGDGFYLFELAEISNITGCSPDAYADYTDLSAELANNTVNDLTITTHYGSQYIKVWIDFNDNFVFENDEIVVDDYVIASGQGGGVYTETMPLTIPDGVNIGQHIMRAKSNWNSPVPDNACQGTSYGETEDYTANVVLYIGVDNIPLKNTDMVVKDLGSNKYEISLQTNETAETLILNLHNVLGQKLVENRVENINGRYVYNLDLSYTKPGAYIVRLGTTQYGKVKKIIVK